MKKFIFILMFLILCQFPSMSMANDSTSVVVYDKDGAMFGLKKQNGEIITEPVYKKLVRLEDSSYIVQKGNKFGIISKNGEYLVKPKYRHAERFFGKYAKLGNDGDYGLYDKDGNLILPHEYDKIDVLFGKMFLTCKDYKYGIADMNGKIIFDNKFDDIYMPNPKTMRIKYMDEWVEIERVKNSDIKLPDSSEKVILNDKEYSVTHLITNTGLWSEYSALTLTDYIVKILSSISPAYEETIDELMLSHGTDTVNIFMKLEWLPKFPVTYMKKYYQILINPNNGPLSDVRSSVKKQMK